MEQKEIWVETQSQICVDDIIMASERPNIPQQEFAEYLNNIIKNWEYDSCIEVGCEMATTSFLLNCKRKYLLDFNEHIIDLLKLVGKEKGFEDTVPVHGDMFHMPFENGMFDMSFNAGVIEHYSYEYVIEALKEMARVTKDDGRIVVAVPNHFSYVYRLAYLIGKKLDDLNIKRWPYPSENKIYDLQQEAKEAGLELVERKVLSEKSLFVWWRSRYYMPLRIILKIINRIIPSEGYLTVLQFKKKY